MSHSSSMTSCSPGAVLLDRRDAVLRRAGDRLAAVVASSPISATCALAEVRAETAAGTETRHASCLELCARTSCRANEDVPGTEGTRVTVRARPGTPFGGVVRARGPEVPANGCKSFGEWTPSHMRTCPETYPFRTRGAISAVAGEEEIPANQAKADARTRTADPITSREMDIGRSLQIFCYVVGGQA